MKNLYRGLHRLIAQILKLCGCIFQFLSDLNMLRAVTLALSAANALGRAARVLAERGTLEIIASAGFLSLGVHRVIAAERSRNVDAFGTWHTVTASG